MVEHKDAVHKVAVFIAGFEELFPIFFANKLHLQSFKHLHKFTSH